MKKRIVFGITSLNPGGAERVLIDLANKLCNDYDVTILTLYPNGLFENQLSKKVNITSIYKEEYSKMSSLQRKKISLSLITPILRNKIYKQFIKDKYDVEISFLEGPMTWIMSCGNKDNKIAWIHNDIDKVFGESTKSNYKQKMNETAYTKFNKLVFVSDDNLNKFENKFKDNKVKKVVIKNYIDQERIINKAKEEISDKIDGNPSFLQISRLVEQKGVDRLIDVHKKLIDDGFNHKIYIIGDGPLKEELQIKINENKLNNSFILLGTKENPYPYIKQADYFMLTSHYEGYGMVLDEAKTFNKYILITNTAAREAVEGYESKLIVDNTSEGIYEGLKEIIQKKPQANKGKNNINEYIIEQIKNEIERI